MACLLMVHDECILVLFRGLLIGRFCLVFGKGILMLDLMLGKVFLVCLQSQHFSSFLGRVMISLEPGQQIDVLLQILRSLLLLYEDPYQYLDCLYYLFLALLYTSL